MSLKKATRNRSLRRAAETISNMVFILREFKQAERVHERLLSLLAFEAEFLLSSRANLSSGEFCRSLVAFSFLLGGIVHRTEVSEVN